MNHPPKQAFRHAYRQFYRPAPTRIPEWLRRVWIWL